MTMRALCRTTTALFLISAPAMAGGPVFTRAGGIAAPGANPTWSIDSAGNAHLATATVGGSAVATASTLSSTQVAAALGTVSRSLAARFSDSLNVRDYGAECDGVTDDTVPLQDAIDIATGNIANSTTLTVGQKAAAWFANLIGTGPNANGAARIIVPSGACAHSATLVANLNRNSGFAIQGDGPSNSFLVHTAAGDGLHINMVATATGTDIAHDARWPGQAFLVKGLNFENASGGPSGTAVVINGSFNIPSSTPPTDLIEDVAVSDAAGWGNPTANPVTGTTSGYTRGIVANNVAFLNENRVQVASRAAAIMIHGFEYNSTAAAGGIPPNNFICQDCQMMAGGGLGFMSISGYGIQAVFVERPQWVTTDTGITWLAAPNSASGSLSIHGASGSSTNAVLHVSNIGTILAGGDFYYSNGQPVGNWYGEWLDQVSSVNISADQVFAPSAGSLTAGDASYGFLVNTATTGVETGIPAVITGSAVAGGDYGFGGQGPGLLYAVDACKGTTTCAYSTNTGSTTANSPHFASMLTGPSTVLADAGNDQAFHEVPQQFFSGGLEIGMPGIPLASGGTGYPGGIDLHSVSASSVGTQNDYDVRLTATGGVAGTSGQGGLSILAAAGVTIDGTMTAGNFGTPGGLFTPQVLPYVPGASLSLGGGGGITVPAGSIATTNNQPLTTNAPFLQETAGPVLAPSFRVIGFPAPASPTAACAAGTFGPGVANGLFDSFYCAASGTELYSPLFTGAPGGIAAWPGGIDTSSALIDGSPVDTQAVSGATINGTDGTGGQILSCASTTTLASLTFRLPLNPAPKQTLHLTSECTITSLTVTTGASAAGVTPTVLGAPTAISPSAPITWVYDNTGAAWARW